MSELPQTIAELPFFVRGRFQKPDVLGRCAGDRVEAMDGRELVERVRDLGLGLEKLGMGRGARVALLAESRPDWLICDLAVLASGGTTVPIYPTLSADQVAFILRDAEVRMVIASTPDQARKVLAAAPQVASLAALVVMEGAEDVAREVGPTSLPIVSLFSVAQEGHAELNASWGIGKKFQDLAGAVQPDDLATIIYTSGTTGDPKGVMLTHRNLLANLEGVGRVLALTQDDTALSFLPLCHAFERTVAYVYLSTGVSMVFAESIDTVARDLLRVRPTVMSGVPRVFEKLHARILERGAQAAGLRKRLFGWALGVATRVGAARERRGQPGTVLRWQATLADRLVFERVREGLGGRLRLAVSGSAPLRPDLGRLFLGMGLPILEGYGLTETAPVLTVTPLEDIRFGTVGPALPNVELMIAPDGEVLARGPNVMQGYFKRPDDTAAVLRDGWFHTGDIGRLDADGYLTITDRKKELIVTSGGKKIAPQPLEEALRAHDLIAEVVIVGERRHFPSALIVPNLTALSRRVGAALPDDDRGIGALLARTEARAAIQNAVDALNAGLAQFERIKRFELLPRPFTLESGELTPTLKVKRRVVEERYREVIERMYRGGVN